MGGNENGMTTCNVRFIEETTTRACVNSIAALRQKQTL
jgi:hypothetical protein